MLNVCLGWELERREEQERERCAVSVRRHSFRDNTLGRRFELFDDGSLAGYVYYSMRSGSLRLHRTVVAAASEGAGLEDALIRNVLPNAHKRRLSAMPYCAQVQAFLADHPEYRVLLAS
jgi:predicted GNAT family acetyltransferase